MMMKKRVLLVVLFLAANVAMRVIAANDDAEPPAPDAPALDASNYEAASDAEIAAAFADQDQVVVCVAADTESGCR